MDENAIRESIRALVSLTGSARTDVEWATLPTATKASMRASLTRTPDTLRDIRAEIRTLAQAIGVEY